MAWNFRNRECVYQIYQFFIYLSQSTEEFPERCSKLEEVRDRESHVYVLYIIIGYKELLDIKISGVILPWRLVFQIWQQEVFSLLANLLPYPYHINAYHLSAFLYLFCTMLLLQKQTLSGIHHTLLTLAQYLSNISQVNLKRAERVNFNQYLKNISRIKSKILSNIK